MKSSLIDCLLNKSCLSYFSNIYKRVQHSQKSPSVQPSSHRRSLHRTLSDESIYRGQRLPSLSDSVTEPTLGSDVLFSCSTLPRSPTTRGVPLRRPSYKLGVKLHGKDEDSGRKCLYGVSLVCLEVLLGLLEFGQESTLFHKQQLAVEGNSFRLLYPHLCFRTGDLSASDTSLVDLVERHRGPLPPELMPLPSADRDSPLEWTHLVDVANTFETERNTHYGNVPRYTPISAPAVFSGGRADMA